MVDVGGRGAALGDGRGGDGRTRPGLDAWRAGVGATIPAAGVGDADARTVGSPITMGVGDTAATRPVSGIEVVVGASVAVIGAVIGEGMPVPAEIGAVGDRAAVGRGKGVEVAAGSVEVDVGCAAVGGGDTVSRVVLAAGVVPAVGDAVAEGTDDGAGKNVFVGDAVAAAGIGVEVETSVGIGVATPAVGDKPAASVAGALRRSAPAARTEGNAAATPLVEPKLALTSGRSTVAARTTRAPAAPRLRRGLSSPCAMLTFIFVMSRDVARGAPRYDVTIQGYEVGAQQVWFRQRHP